MNHDAHTQAPLDAPILLVDDEKGIRNVLGITLTDMGYAVHTAEDGATALKKFKSLKPAVVLTDIKMPGMDGIELLKQIKAEVPATEVIMITGHGEMELAIKSLKYEATDFITKPIHDEALEIALKRAHERIAMRRQLHDYTHHLEKLVEEKSRKLIAAERLAVIGQTVKGLTHTIKNITSGLKGGAFVMEKGFELQDMEYLVSGWEMVRKNVTRVANLTLDLLNFAKTSELQFEAVSPNAPAQEVYGLMQPKAMQMGLILTYQPDTSLPPLRIDPEAIECALLNLITNAFDACQNLASPDTKGKIDLSTQRHPNSGVIYTVADNGCGIPPSVLKDLFKRFITTKGLQGTGIGLVMTKSIIDHHQGTLDVHSQMGKGTEFRITLPDLTVARAT